MRLNSSITKCLHSSPILFTFILLVIASSCERESPFTVEVTIDNPSEESIEVTFASNSVTIAPNSSAKEFVKPGVHQLKYKAIDTSFYFKDKSKVLLNPTLSTYYKEEVVYATVDKILSVNDLSATSMKYFPLKLLTIEDSINIFGPYKVINDKILISGFDINVDQNLPKQLRTTEHEKQVHQVKVYRVSEFYNRLAKSFPEFQKRMQTQLIKKAPTQVERINVDYYKEREIILYGLMGDSTNSKQSASKRISVMELNINGDYSTIVMRTKSEALFLHSDGIMIRDKLTLSENASKSAKSSLSSAASFYTNVPALLGEEKNVDKFILPQPGEVVFHAQTADTKKSKTLSYDELVKNSMKSVYTTPFDMIYRQGDLILSFLKRENKDWK